MRGRAHLPSTDTRWERPGSSDPGPSWPRWWRPWPVWRASGWRGLPPAPGTQTSIHRHIRNRSSTPGGCGRGWRGGACFQPGRRAAPGWGRCEDPPLWGSAWPPCSPASWRRGDPEAETRSVNQLVAQDVQGGHYRLWPIKESPPPRVQYLNDQVKNMCVPFPSSKKILIYICIFIFIEKKSWDLILQDTNFYLIIQSFVYDRKRFYFCE